MNSKRAVIATIALVAGCDAESRSVADSRVPILGSVSHQVESRQIGDTFQVSVVLPRSYRSDTTRRYPVVYLLDGNELIGVAASIAWDMRFSGMPDMILVGVDYPASDLDDSQGIRYRDLTPSVDTATIASAGPAFAKLGLPVPTSSGGGSRFVAFLTDELGPRIDNLYRTDGSNRTLLGVSLGGLLTLHALLQRPAYFHNYVAISPSLWWNKGETLARFASMQSGTQPAPRLFVSVGLLEESPAYLMVSNVRRLEAILATHPSMSRSSHFQYFPEENHNSGWPAALSRGLRYVFRLWPPDAQPR